MTARPCCINTKLAPTVRGLLTDIFRLAVWLARRN